MDLRTALLLHSKSKLLSALLCIVLITITVAGCDKNDKQAPPPTVPVVTTATPSNITPSGATAGGSIVSDGGATVTASGIVWSQTNATPTLADSVVAGTTANGTFTSEITGLDFDKSYYVRAFATNSVGTGYGSVVTLNTVTDTNKVRFTYNGEEVVYGIIVSQASGRKWLDRNLGAKQVATAYDDYLAYGDLFQWGRPADGHQWIDWTTSTTGTAVNGIIAIQATTDNPGHSDLILAPWTSTSNFDWRDDNNRNRWTTNPQGPCPSGWHVPSLDEWSAEHSTMNADGSPSVFGTAPSGGMNDRSSAYSLLKLTTAGCGDQDGPDAISYGQTGSSGHYWTINDKLELDGYNTGRDVELKDDRIQVTAHPKTSTLSVRCIKD